MKPSKFNIFIPRIEDDEFLVFNTYSSSSTIVSRKTRQILESPLIHEQSFSEDERGCLQELTDLGIVLKDDVNEDLEIEKYLKSMIFDNTFLDITLLTTYQCNLMCTDCHESGTRWESSISRDTCRLIILWIIKRLEEVRPQTLRLVFAGGEPLLNLTPIRLISEELYYSCKKRNINIEIRLITNGILLTEDIVEELNNYGLKGITLTFEGDQKDHDSRRRFKDGKGTFHAIIEQVQRIRGRTPITIYVKFDDNSIEDLPGLLDHLKEAGFSNNDVSNIRFKPILRSIGKGCRENKACAFSGIRMEDFLWLKKECTQRGFISPDDLDLGPCEAVRENNYVIDPDGKIYKCTGFAGREEFIIGDISSDESLIRMNSQFVIADLWQKCRGCPYIPACGGGCRVNSHALWGNILGRDCKAEYEDRILNNITVLSLQEHGIPLQ